MSSQKHPFFHVNTLLLVVAMLPALISCKSDDENPGSNAITLDGDSFKVQVATLIGVSIDGEGHAAITFVSTDGTTSRSLSIDFEYTPDSPVSGTYSFPQEGDDRYLDAWLTNYTEINQSGNDSESTNLEMGTVTVKDNGGSNYTVTMDLMMVDGKVFKGTYSGKMQAMFNNG